MQQQKISNLQQPYISNVALYQQFSLTLKHSRDLKPGNQTRNSKQLVIRHVLQAENRKESAVNDTYVHLVYLYDTVITVY